ncbi:pyridoxal 5'-phosphate synthase glutaminase subunit PdxT [Demequina activiva]|uniref:Pyridoxal 5'-phosphate synthase subunit PdxT n=1 Tax=Demequina activiva TaxID=1582364 RepID=A0A919Q257_9MICO|nr:pyridoxal 5'-phosphate synthase glutaminase subunit PdxT [Demequina activiva]GIG54649.1 pyridoxal 5'-phosphate synthase subunit PdxT [Demequina activiva]
MTHVGVLALQGDVREHQVMLESVGARVTRVRRLSELEDVDALVIPGGESTTIDKLLRAFDLRDTLVERLHAGLPVLGSCAGMILLSTEVIGGIEGQQTLGAIPMTVRRNAFGRQVDSAEVELVWEPDGSGMHATFIRAPWVEAHSASVEVLATAEGPDGSRHPVAVRHGRAIATAFHPEISSDARVHSLLLQLVDEAR